MIERYKYSRTSITPGPASLPTTVSESTTQSIPDPSSRPSLAALTSSTTTTTVSSVIPPKDDSNNYQSGRLVSWSYPQVAASSHLSSSNSSSSLSSTNHLSQSAESTSVDTSSSNCHLAQTHKQPLALSPLPSKIIISRSENTSVDHANRDSQLRTATEPSGVSDS
ncbi:unnamed protein product [Protopolystoma xenopodis]|uniref:Uncharacterized protein n=1 Tax=Protopolystoma xenopodis TaxID=117903 RepID=A0A448WWV7_9PLAT|nr:unnamed protein product [Protopolystoma xenopodis]